ncbi:hypothetical protein GMM32_03965 [Salmonella enterica subsp. diarizonae]|nr:hypothetical protein [Salmonella enterica subsp. diarizonae]EHG9469462.1 hypothetical protein [Salmonella enterica subsp. enterica serovar Newport]EJH2660497.1 hypothetical protein [Salmonella enterica]EDU5553167.1 hypothetical protein [Salmonella enterica subsp. diarizonae]EDU8206782.1 hypothetical protein [Salmonella enterica subsp. diarizonae]
MEKVYIVCQNDDLEWHIRTIILSVHATKDGAEKAKESYNKNNGTDHMWATIEEKEVEL